MILIRLKIGQVKNRLGGIFPCTASRLFYAEKNPKIKSPLDEKPLSYLHVGEGGSDSTSSPFFTTPPRITLANIP